MMKFLRYISLITLVLLVTECRKDEPGTHVNYSEDVVFFVKGSADGKPFEYKAGQNGYVMASDYHFNDSVVEMRGRLLPHGNLNRAGVEIRIRGEQHIGTLSDFDPAQNFESGALPLRDATGFRQETGKYIINLSCDTTQGQYASHLWIFPDGTFSNAYSVEKKVDISNYPQYPVRLETSGAFSCQSEVYHEINLGGDCDAGFDVNMLANFSVALSLKNIQGNIDRVDWYLNDNPVTPSPIDNSIYLGNTGNPHHIRCEVTFTNSCVKVMERKLSANFAANCITDFHYQVQKEVVFDPQQLSTVEIIYYDDNGKKYTSYYPDAQGEFEVITLSPYMENDEGDPTMQVFFEADAILKSVDGSSIQMTNLSGSFALAYP